MKVTLINYTNRAKEILIFSKNTRHLDDRVRFEQVIDMPEEQKNREIQYVFGTISSSLEFVNYTFLLQDVTRAFTHQLVRSRVGTSFAQQSLRVAAMDEFRYLVPDKIENDLYVNALYENTMGEIQTGYDLMLKKGADIQDARGVLPTNICTNILFGVNLRALSNLMEARLCVRAQGEFQEAAMKMRSLVLSLHPWVYPAIAGPTCVTKNYCPFKNFTECPIKKANTVLDLLPEEFGDKIAEDWSKLIEHKYSPQPMQSKEE